MRTEAEMYPLILKVAKSLTQVKAVALSGSRVNPDVPKDCFQDYDIVYVVDDKESLLKDRKWLGDFGERLIMQTPEEMTLFPAELGERFTFLMLFKDGNRIDLTLCPISAIATWLKDEPKHLLKQVEPITKAAFRTEMPTEAEFKDCCTEFWWVSTYVVKGLCRKELTYASDHLYENCQKELLRLLSWQVVSRLGPKSIGKNDKYLFKYLPAEAVHFAKLRDFTSATACWQALLETQKYFHKQAMIFSIETGFYYDKDMAIAIQNYTKIHEKNANY